MACRRERGLAVGVSGVVWVAGLAAGLFGVRGSTGGVGVCLRGVAGGFMGCLAAVEVVDLLGVSLSFAAMLLLILAAGRGFGVATRPAVLSFFTGSKAKPVEVKPVALVLKIDEGEEIAFGGAELKGLSSSSAIRP